MTWSANLVEVVEGNLVRDDRRRPWGPVSPEGPAGARKPRRAQVRKVAGLRSSGFGVETQERV